MQPTPTQNQNNPFVNFVTDLVKKTKGSVSDIVNSLAKSGSVPNYLSDVAIKNVVKPLAETGTSYLMGIPGQQSGETTQQYNQRQQNQRDATVNLFAMGSIPGPTGLMGVQPITPEAPTVGEVAAPVKNKVASTIPKTDIPIPVPDVKPPVEEGVSNLPKIDNRPTIDSQILDKNGVPFKTPVNQYATPDANPLTGESKLPPINKPLEVPPIKETGKIPYPNVPLNPEDVSAARTGKNPLTGGNPVLVDLRNEAKRNPYYLEDQTKSRAIMDQYVPGNTPTEVEYNLPKKLTEESQRIKNIIGNDPQRINVNDLVTQNEAELAKQGYTPGNSVKADNATRGGFNELDSQIGTHENAPGKIQVSGNDLENYKKILDKKLQSVYKKMDLGTTLTPEETSMLTMRRTINNNLREMYPEVGDALDRQSAMIDARPSVAKSAGAQEVADTATANLPKINKLDAFIKSPQAKIGGWALGGLGVGEFARGGKDLTPIAEMSANLLNPNINKEKGTTGGNPEAPVNTTLPSHLPIQDIKDKTGSQVTMDEYQQNINDPAYAPGSNARANLESQFANTKNIAANKMPGTIPQFMGSAQQALQKESSLQGADLNKLSDVLLKLKIPKDYQSYISNPKNPFVTELMNLQTINDYFKLAYHNITGSTPSDDFIIGAGNSAQQIRQRNNYQIKWLMDTYSNYQPYWDSINPTSKTNTSSSIVNKQNTNQQQGGLPPIQNQSIPSGFKIGGGDFPSLGNLPAIQ